MNCHQCVSRWRSWIRPLVVIAYVLLLLIALPLMIVEFHLNGTQHHVQAWFIGGFFVVMTIPISLWGILQHIIHYNQPVLQRHIVRVLWMVPIYAGDAWFALRFKSAAIYLDTLRECYEAYVIYNFMAYLMAFLYSQHPNLEEHISQKPQVKHIFPFCCLPSWAMGSSLISLCKHGALQYTVIRPVTTCIALVTQLAGVYGEGDFSFKSAWSYLAVINNISQVWAMYCLVLFYLATKEELQPMKPVSKFLCVKAVVFMSFWQQVLIAALVKLGVIKDTGTWVIYDSAKDVATGLQDFCICIEMFLAAIAHYFSFSHKPYIDPDAGQTECCSSFMSMWDVSDVRDDVYNHVRTVGKTVTRPLRRGGGAESERTPLLSESREDGAGARNKNMEEVVNYTQESNQQQRPDSPNSIGDYLDAGADQRSYTASMNNYLDTEGSYVGSEDELCDNAAEKGDKNPKRGASNLINDQSNQLIPGLQDNAGSLQPQCPVTVEVHGITPVDLSDYDDDIDSKTLVNIPAEIANSEYSNTDDQSKNLDTEVTSAAPEVC